MEFWLTFTVAAFTGFCFGAVVGLQFSDGAIKTLSGKVWTEIMHKRIDVERTLVKAEEDMARQRTGGFDLGPRT